MFSGCTNQEGAQLRVPGVNLSLTSDTEQLKRDTYVIDVFFHSFQSTFCSLSLAMKLDLKVLDLEIFYDLRKSCDAKKNQTFAK